MTKYIDCESALAMLHKDEFGTPDERWRPESEIAEAILRIPPADVRPVRHGRWVWNPDGMDWGIGAWCCSECKSKAETWWANDQKYNPLHCSGGHFCGNCGAKMDGGGDDDGA